MTELQQALRQATEHVGSPDLASRALASAHRRRVRRTSLGALAAVVLVGGGVAWVVQDREPRAGVVDTPGPTPTPTATPSEIDTDPATQPIWDPFTVVDAPRRASVLPEHLSPPAEAPSITDSPLPDIVVAWPEEGKDLRLLASNGYWRSVPGTATAIRGSLYDVVDPAISPDGSHVAMSTDAGILVVAGSGDQQVLPWPPELAGPFDTRPALQWLPDDAGFVVLHWERPWLVRPDGTGEPAPFGGTSGRAVPMVDPDTGAVLERRMDRLLTWNSVDDASAVRLAGFGERFVTRFGRVVYVGNPGVASMSGLQAGPIVVDPGTGKVVAYAPIRDRDSVYSDNGHLTPLGLLDEDTVVLLVTPMDFRTMEPSDGVTHLITWNHRTGEFELMASGGPAMRRIDVAVDLLEQSLE